MKDSEFMEILNLYLDHEVSAADTIRLEAEVMNNPQRREIYRQYCRMHKACVLLGAQTAAAAPAWEPARPAALAPRPRAWAFGWSSAGLLAAASLTVMFLVRHHAAVPAAAALAQARIPAAAPAVAAAAVPVAVRADLQPVFTTRALPALADSAGAASVAAPELNDQFAWMNRVQLAPLQGTPVEAAMFQPAPVHFLDTDSGAIGSTPSSQTQGERAAFQFQR
jgi:hypothetical protein